MEQIPITDQRLTLIGEYVRNGCVAADIGTDHAYLIAYLAACGKIKKGYACDINELPIEKAKATVQKYNLQDKIECVLTDGLKGLNLAEIDDIIIAGMGGDTIIEILSAESYDFIGKNFIFQPMTKFERLREGLCNLGFKIAKEEPVVSGKFVYTLLVCTYDGKKRQCNAIYKYLGEITKSTSPIRNKYLKRIYINLSRRIDGLKKTSGHNDEISDYESVINEIEKCCGGKII